MFSIIFTDIDGTLLTDERKISPDTIDALKKASDSGIIIALSSGRYLASLDRIASELPFPVMKIAVNGALIEYGGEFLQDIRISEEAYRKGAEYLKGKCSSLISFASRGYAIDAGDSWFGLQRDMMGTEGVRMDLRDPHEVTKALGERPCKLLAKDNDEGKLAALKTELTKLLEGDADIVSSGPVCLEILPHGVDKGKAISLVSHKLSIPLSEMIAFGDWDNDIGMLSTVGTGVCMSNGSDGARKAADFITLSNNDDGIAYALRKLAVI